MDIRLGACRRTAKRGYRQARGGRGGEGGGEVMDEAALAKAYTQARAEASIYRLAVKTIKARGLLPESEWIGISEEIRAALMNGPPRASVGEVDLFEITEMILDDLSAPK